MVAITITLSAILAILAGIIILIWPKSLNYAIAIYLILVGILQLLSGYLSLSPPF